MKLPRAILFDMDDTILSAYGEPEKAWQAVAGEFADQMDGLSMQQLADAVSDFGRRFWSDRSMHKHWRLNLEEARHKIVAGALTELATKGHSVPDAGLAFRIAERYTSYRKEKMHLFPGVEETLAHFKAAGVKLALITNGAAHTQRAKVERFALEQHFSHIQIEGEHGFGKPEEQAYRHALDTLGVAASETWMVGDNLEWEVEVPQGLGMRGIWCDAYAQGLPANTHVKPDKIIHRLPELLSEEAA
ncbi:HAD family hydrolase [Ferrovibrio sp.]|uniref:HAD family hydrolase n=1 Tax=Ferrovibrio sp. TaxID=1917215 RepID=UPI003D2B3FCD